MAASPGAVGSGVAGTVGVGAQFCGAGSTCAPTSAGSLGVATSGLATGVWVRPDKAVRSRRSAAVPRSAPSSRTLDGVAAGFDSRGDEAMRSRGSARTDGAVPCSARSSRRPRVGVAAGFGSPSEEAVRWRCSARTDGAAPCLAPSSRTLGGVAAGRPWLLAAGRPWLLADPLLGRFALRPDDAGLLRRCVVRSPSPRAVRFVASVCERRRCWVDRVDLPLACPLSRVDALARPRR